jgi:hypothetical protein
MRPKAARQIRFSEKPQEGGRIGADRSAPPLLRMPLDRRTDQANSDRRRVRIPILNKGNAGGRNCGLKAGVRKPGHCGPKGIGRSV